MRESDELIVGSICYYPEVGVCAITTLEREKVGGLTILNIELATMREHRHVEPKAQFINKITPINKFANRKLLRLLPEILGGKSPADIGTSDWYWKQHHRVYTSCVMNDLLEVLRDINHLRTRNYLEPKWQDIYTIVFKRVVDACSVAWDQSLPTTMNRINEQLINDPLQLPVTLQPKKLKVA